MIKYLFAGAALASMAHGAATASHVASQYTGQPIGPILGTFSTGSGSFSGVQTFNQLMPYTFYGVAGGAFSADTAGSNYDTGLSLLFKGSSPVVASDMIGTDLSIIAENDDFIGLQSYLSGTFGATGYYVLTVGGFGGSTGDYVLNLNGGSPIGLVPEPSAWALLILGFGAVGAGMRRHVSARVALA